MKRKRYRSVIAAVYREPWAILPAKLDDIMGFIDLKRDGLTVAAEDVAAIVGSRRQAPQQPASGIAVLSMLGTIVPRASAMSQASGCASLSAFMQAFDAAMASEDIGTIIGYFDTPGGAVQGVQEAADKIRAARGRGKTLIAYGDGTLASAGIWLASAFDKIIVAPSANHIGSIGVVRVHTDDTGAMEKEGIVRTYLTSDKSPYKAEGVGPLTDEAKAYEVDRLNAIYDQFAGTVAANLNLPVASVEKNFGRGRTMMAKDALATGMVHRIATFDQVLSELGVGPGSMSGEAAIQPQPPIKGNVMTPEEIAAKKKADDEAAALAKKASETATVTADRISAGDITAMVKLAAIPDSAKLDLMSELVSSAAPMSVSAVLNRINAVAVEHNKPAGATVIAPQAAERDKFVVEARDALLTRAWAGKLPAKVYDMAKDEDVDWKPQKRNYGLQSSLGLAEACLVQAGYQRYQLARLAPADIAMLVMGMSPRDIGIGASSVSDGSYNVTGMFSNVFFDAQNMILRRGYSETGVTFDRWAKQGESIVDFKPVNKIILGELPDPKLIPEDGEFEETTTIDGRVSYSLVVWGERFSLTWQMVVNDRLNAFSDITGRQGRAMRRKQNKLVYQVLKDNANLPDGGALFNTTAIASAGGHNNLVTGALTPTVASLNGMKARMRSQTGLNVSDQTVLNLEPAFLMCGANLEGTVAQLLRSMADPASGNANVANIWNGQLEPVVDAQLDAVGGGSDTAWYLACDPADCDTVEYAYLQGVEQPRLLQRQSLNSLSMKWDIYQAFATKAIDYRGLQKANGV